MEICIHPIQLKLEKSCEELTTQLDLYQSFLDRMNRWMKENGMKAEELFRKFDTNQDGSLSYDEFKAGDGNYSDGTGLRSSESRKKKFGCMRELSHSLHPMRS